MAYIIHAVKPKLQELIGGALHSQLPSKLKIYFKNKLLFELFIQNQMDYCKILCVIIFTAGTQITYIYFLTETGKVLMYLFFLLFG